MSGARLSIKEKELTELTVKLSNDVYGYCRSNNLNNTQRNIYAILNIFKISFYAHFTILTIKRFHPTSSFSHGSIPTLFVKNSAPFLMRTACSGKSYNIIGRIRRGPRWFVLPPSSAPRPALLICTKYCSSYHLDNIRFYPI